MHSTPELLQVYAQAATKAIEAIGGVKAFKQLPIFGAKDRKSTALKAAA